MVLVAFRRELLVLLATFTIRRRVKIPTHMSSVHKSLVCTQKGSSFVADSGIRTTHVEFEGRATWGYDAVVNTANTDVIGHGT
jgi:hypothetical protein